MKDEKILMTALFFPFLVLRITPFVRRRKYHQAKTTAKTEKEWYGDDDAADTMLAAAISEC